MAKIITLFRLLPKKHQILLGILSLVAFIILIFPTEEASAFRQTPPATTNVRYDVPLAFRTPEAPNTVESSESGAVEESEAAAEAITSEITEETQQSLEPQSDVQPDTMAELEHFDIKKGDTLAAVFSRAQLTAREVYDITQLPLAKKNLIKIMPGEEIVIGKNADGSLQQLRYQIDAISTLLIKQHGDGYQATVIDKDVENRQQFARAEIKSNFWNAGIDAGLTPAQIMQLATIFGWDVDFALDIREGDSFALIYEQEYADGEFLRNGNILAAEFINQGQHYTAVRYTDGNYYSADGHSMHKAFLRSPVDFKYVSSNFNPKRLHPVTGLVRPHRGVDYVAAIGTPIKAAGDGKVIEASYNQYNGNYVFIKHNETYTTKYLHLNKRKVKRGDTVKQGQIIGTLGRTGRVTGAHLHYEFIVNGVHRNPRTVDLPKALPIASKEKAAFTALSHQLMAKLAQNQQVRIAKQ
ncbi:peptidoglycan DD-metalloendopeptidase family protein [Shewanella yunxiaonensis]|uniref:Peptidoglycan DD-metalloendopeptidase family protein n=1 Tax=Shewanella yunxiaonensis TaxID=2829809 RepID=A0ABX7YQB8_9GAMM|nr:peptidoglycan DD-metalloendopeptidase family protein [Shewanella yunxiaonensis]QUN04968.1 peptidoglycan DD-metalloendopeptidase family protein [Shewanella yunxiaonensis]